MASSPGLESASGTAPYGRGSVTGIGQAARFHDTRLRPFLLLCGCLLAILLAVHAGRMERIGFTTHDDLAIELSAKGVQTRGFSYALAQAGKVARNQGRVSYYVSYFLAIAPWLLDDDTARGLLVTGVHFLSLAALCGLLAFYLGLPLAVLALTTMYALLPHWWRHFPIAAYPIQFHAAVLFFSVAAILQLLPIRFHLAPRPVWALRAVSLGLLYLALSVYEVAAVLFGFLLAVALAGEWRETPVRRRDVRNAALSMGAVFVFYGGLYLTYRLWHPPVYVGVQVSAGSMFNPVAVARAVGVYAAGGLPLAQFYLQSEIVSRYSADSLAAVGLARFWFRGLTALGVIEALLFAAVAVYFLRRPVSPGVLRRAVTAGLAACAGALIAPVPIAVTTRYQQNPAAITPYIPGYFCFLGYAVAAACGLAVAGALLPRFGRVARRAACLGIAAAAFLAITMTGIANDAVVRSQESHYATWKLAKLFLRSERFQALPEDPTIVAPTLWDEIDPVWPHYETYWQTYFTIHGGRTVRVVRTLPVARPEKTPLFYLEIQPMAGLGEPLLLFHDISASMGPPVSQAALVISQHDLKAAALRYLRLPEGVDRLDWRGMRDGRLETLPLAPCRYERGAYITQTAAPQLAIGTATVESGRTAGGIEQTALANAPVEVAFERGFSELHEAPPAYWRWGMDAEAVLAIVNRTGAPLPLTVKLVLRTCRPGKLRFDFTVAGRPRSVEAADGALFEQTLTAEAGRNEIRIQCHGTPLAGINQPVFGVENWEVTPAGATPSGALPSVEFGAGFSALEDWHGVPFRWNDSASGEATLTLVNRSNHPVRAVFSAGFFTGYPEKSRFELRIGGRQESLDLDRDRRPISRPVELQPGRTEVFFKSFAAPLEGTAPRRIRFGICDWSLTAVPSGGKPAHLPEGK